MLFADMTAWDFLNANWGWFATAGGAIGVFMTGMFGAICRGIYVVYQDWVAKHNAREDSKAQKEGKTLDTLTETLPMLAENGKRQTELLTESRKIDSDLIKTQHAIKTSIGDLAIAIVAGACPDKREDVQRHVRRVTDRVKPAKDSDSSG